MSYARLRQVFVTTWEEVSLNHLVWQSVFFCAYGLAGKRKAPAIARINVVTKSLCKQSNAMSTVLRGISRNKSFRQPGYYLCGWKDIATQYTEQSPSICLVKITIKWQLILLLQLCDNGAIGINTLKPVKLGTTINTSKLLPHQLEQPRFTGGDQELPLARRCTNIASY